MCELLTRKDVEGVAFGALEDAGEEVGLLGTQAILSCLGPSMAEMCWSTRLYSEALRRFWLKRMSVFGPRRWRPCSMRKPVRAGRYPSYPA